MQSPQNTAYGFMHKFAIYWRKNLISEFFLSIATIIFLFTFDPNVYLEDPEAVSMLDGVVSLAIIGFGIAVLFFLVKMITSLKRAAMLLNHQKLMMAYKAYMGSILTIIISSIIDFFLMGTIESDIAIAIISTTMQLFQIGLIAFSIYCLKGYIIDFADHSSDPNKSKPFDNMFTIYMIQIGIFVVIQLINLITDDNITFILILVLQFIDIIVKVLLARQIELLYKTYAFAGSRPSSITQFGQPQFANQQFSSYGNNSPNSETTRPIDQTEQKFSYDQWAKTSSKPDKDADFKRCPECGAKIPIDSSMCGICGSIL